MAGEDMGKYQRLADYAAQQTLQQFRLTFREIETILEARLPASANRPQFWANTVGKGSPIREVMRHTKYETFLEPGSPPRVLFRR
jgi:hypothetical protein